MTLRHFEIFIAVCEKMSMSAAANQLFVSQSAVSQSIRDLEDYYKTKLFERYSRKLYLTMAGEELLNYARHMLEYNFHIESAMRTARARAKLRVGAVVPYLIVDLVAEYERKHADSDIVIQVDSRDNIVSLLFSAGLDMAVIDGYVDNEEMISHPITTNHMVFVCNKNTRLHPALKAARPVLKPEELKELPMLIREGSCTVRRQLDRLLHGKGLEYTIKGTFNSFEGIQRAVEQDVGVSIVYDKTVSEKCKTFSVAGFEMDRELFLVYHRKKHIYPEIIRFIAFAEEFTAGLYNKFKAGGPPSE